MKIGLFFGSFNPVHMGHLIIAQTIVSSSDLDKVWFVVSPQSPFKKKSNLVHEFDRYDMIKEAIDQNDDLDVTDVEFNLPKPSYTIDTLTHLSELYKSYEFSVIMGEDNLSTLHKWKNYEAIVKYYPIYVYPRPKVFLDKEIAVAHTKINAPLLDISASYIRKRLKSNLSIKYLVPSSVEKHIDSKGLFR